MCIRDSLWVEEKAGGNAKGVSCLDFPGDGPTVIKKNEMAFLLLQTGEVTGTEVGGVKHRGIFLCDKCTEGLTGEGKTLPGGAGQREVHSKALQVQGQPSGSEAPDGVLQPLLQDSPGEGGTDEHVGQGEKDVYKRQEQDSGRVLYEQNADEKRLIASITKIMTAVVALEEGDIQAEYTVTAEDRCV